MHATRERTWAGGGGGVERNMRTIPSTRLVKYFTEQEWSR